MNQIGLISASMVSRYHECMALPVTKQRFSIAEYLELEEKAVDRHEFHDGEILAMSGGTYAHSRVNTNFLVSLGTRLRNHRCHTLDSNMRVRIPNRAKYLYPDGSVICSTPEFDADDRKLTTITNPTLIVETLSESTEAYDRGEKFDLYREIPSLREYVLVWQISARVETFIRQTTGGWLFNSADGLDSRIKLQSLDLEIPLQEIYTGVSFPASAPVDDRG